MTQSDFATLIREVNQRKDLVTEYLNTRNPVVFSHQHLLDATYSYIHAGGKSLRSAVMMFACGAVGGDEETALPAAAAIELYHTFTLVHDDIIDRDEMRRGIPTVHTEFTRRAQSELGYDLATAKHYGLSVAILTGDVQQGWAASLLPDLYHSYGVPAELALNLTRELFHNVLLTLINGETSDIVQSVTPVEQLTEEEVLKMLWEKTGILYEFAGRAGAAIGLKTADLNHPTVTALSQFTSKCGTAFQIQDDILGITADEKKLGKPVGSDIREGKRTIIVLHALKNLSPADQDTVLKTLGNHNATPQQIDEVTALLIKGGGVEHAKQLAETYIAEALEHIAPLPDTPQKNLLIAWANYITGREL
jgi:geranylgeranyl diphosphate synthase type I